MRSVSIEEAYARLPELIEHLAAGEQLEITRNQEPIARLCSEEKGPRRSRKVGNAKGQFVIVVDDDAHLKDFAECLESTCQNG